MSRELNQPERRAATPLDCESPPRTPLISDAVGACRVGGPPHHPLIPGVPQLFIVGDTFLDTMEGDRDGGGVR
jgi:hypothetical protein